MGGEGDILQLIPAASGWRVVFAMRAGTPGPDLLLSPTQHDVVAWAVVRGDPGNVLPVCIFGNQTLVLHPDDYDVLTSPSFQACIGFLKPGEDEEAVAGLMELAIFQLQQHGDSKRKRSR